MNVHIINSIIRQTVNKLGYDVRKKSQSPSLTMLGIKERPIRTIIDIGANHGQSAIEYRHVFPTATIYCFEPQPSVFQTLSAWAKRENGHVKTFNVALGEHVGEMDFNYHLDHSFSSSLLESTNLHEELYPKIATQTKTVIDVLPLDSFVDEIPVIDELLIKIDVQGFERSVIKGAKDFIGKASVCVVEVIVADLYKNQTTFVEIVNEFYELNFTYAGNLSQSHEHNGKCLFFDAVFLNQNK